MISLVFSASMVLSHLATDDSRAHEFQQIHALADLMAIGYMFLLFLVSVAYPLYQCWTRASIPEGDEDGLKPYAEHLKDLASLLSTNSGFLCFRAFLTLEQELHKLLFVESVKAYKSATTSMAQDQTLSAADRNSRMFDLAMNLHADFLSRGCPLVNDVPALAIVRLEDSLPLHEDLDEELKRENSGASASEEMTRTMERASTEVGDEREMLSNDAKFTELPSIYDEVLEFVMNDLSHNAFPRFKSSILYQELELHARRNSFRRKSLVELKIL